ncbi:DUF1722 domain-containing protein [Enterococcus viikkiensis]|uniref:DUF1722 domain-containing protein n=1 Tax=Enterococcus viikkiensis TaxID=930854 RepID=UPI0010F7A373|nr:DUF1722 domain-containing protein [Enterococcus viikkiensis]
MEEQQKEWARWKYFVMARSQEDYLVIRQLFSGNHWSEEKAQLFYQRIEHVKTLPVNVKAQRNAYEHVWGYFKKIASKEERGEFFRRLDRLNETEDFALPYLKKLAEKYQITYLLDSHLFD